MLRRRRLSDGPVAGGYETKKSGNQPGDPLGETTPDAVPVKSRIRRYRDSMDLRIEANAASWGKQENISSYCMQLGSSSTRTMGIVDGSTAPQPSAVAVTRLDQHQLVWVAQLPSKEKRKKKRLLTTLTAFGTWTVTILQVTCEMVGNSVGDGLVLGPGTAATLQCFEVAGVVGDAPTNKQRGI